MFSNAGVAGEQPGPPVTLLPPGWHCLSLQGRGCPLTTAAGKTGRRGLTVDLLLNHEVAVM